MPMSPNRGPTAGGTLVTITGAYLAGTREVLFGSRPAAHITQVSPTQTAMSPAGNGVAGVTLITAAGVSNAAPFY
ncbi:IPT/TIG domain-containing protein [Streptomyces sp. MS1.AVA.3]|uniref:IPT/TIG domain-containing protein n=1 Tax=Streptomyces decoyicus TaxID=249567 RepID=UPI0030C34930